MALAEVPLPFSESSRCGTLFVDLFTEYSGGRDVIGPHFSKFFFHGIQSICGRFYKRMTRFDEPLGYWGFSLFRTYTNLHMLSVFDALNILLWLFLTLFNF